MMICLDAPKWGLALELYGSPFVLAQKWKYSWYRQHFLERPYRHVVIVDHGAYELGRPVDFSEYIRVIEDLKRKYLQVIVLLPDVLQNPRESLYLTAQFMDEYSPVKNMLTMWVCHSLSPAEEIRNAEKFGSEILGIPIWIHRQYNRVRYVQKLLGKWTGLIHLLGLDDPRELLCYSNCRVKSVDTSLPFTLAKHGVRLKNMPPKARYERCRDDDTVTSDTIYLAYRNIIDLKEIAGAYPR